VISAARQPRARRLRAAVRAAALPLGLGAAVAAFASAFSLLAIERHDAFNTGRFDLGNMTQAVWATAHGHFLQVTNLAGEQTSRLGSHFDPILAALAPLWLAWPSPDLLVCVQAIAVGLGAVPVFRLACKRLGSPRTAAAFALAYLLYPAVEWLVLNEFHPVAFACPLLLFAFWYLDEDRLLPFAAFATLAVMSKEEIGLVVAGFGLWYAITRRRVRSGIALAAAGVAVSAIAVEVVVPHFSGGASSFYSRYSEVGGSPGGIVRTLATHPLRLLRHVFAAADLRYLGHLLVPLGGLWALAPVALLAALPEAGLNALSSNPYQRSIHFHYTAGLIAPLFVASILGTAAAARRWRGAAAVAGPAVLLLAIASNYHLGAVPLWAGLPGGDGYQQHATRVTAHDRLSARAVALVPPDAVVSATNALGGHLSARRRILSFPRLDDATWVAVDETQGSYLDGSAPLPMAADLAALRRNPDWRLVFTQDGISVFHRVAHVAGPAGGGRSVTAAAGGGLRSRRRACATSGSRPLRAASTGAPPRRRAATESRRDPDRDPSPARPAPRCVRGSA